MAIGVDVLRTHIDYTIWASRRLLEAAAALSEAELIRDFQTADHSVIGTLAHIFAADRTWLGRLRGNPPAKFLDPAEARLDFLQTEWAAVQSGWSDWAQAQTDASVAAALDYKDLKGNPHSTPLWQIALHVVNHATHHRGQVSGMMRAMGHPPPSVDLIHYYRVNTALS